jgi:hypothetical protein
MAIDLEGDEQDQSEVFDEDNRSLDGEMRSFEELPDVIDVTSALGDDDDDEALIAEELDDDAIIALEADLADGEDEDFGESEPFDDEAEIVLSEGADDEVELEFTGDLDALAVDGADSAVMEASSLSDDDLDDLGYAGEEG